MTESALRGHDKQSIVDAEALLSYSVASALERRGYPKEAHYVKVIAQWHEASDGRAVGRDMTRKLSEEEDQDAKAKSQQLRKKYNLEMLNYIMREIMPWSGKELDYRLFDINRLFSTVKTYLW